MEESLLELAASYVPDRQDEADDIARRLACFTEADLHVLQQAYVDADVFYPGIVFRGAAPDVRDRVVQIVETSRNTLRLNHALLALAWIGDSTVVELFAHWRAHPPNWRKLLYVAPEEYAHGAAWELDEANHRRNLYLPTAYALTESASDAVRVVLPAAGECSWCTGPLATLLRFDLVDPRLAELALPPAVVTCAQCTRYGPMFMKADRDGTSSWHPRNEKPEYLQDEPGTEWTATRQLGLGPQRNVLHAAERFLPTTFSQLGGAPGWIQDFEFPRCPECRRTMGFIAQVDGEEIEDGEGCFYAFWCGDCRVTGTSYQQT